MRGLLPTCHPQVLFVQGGASTQFAALPLNFASEGATVDVSREPTAIAQ